MSPPTRCRCPVPRETHRRRPRHGAGSRRAETERETGAGDAVSGGDGGSENAGSRYAARCGGPAEARLLGPGPGAKPAGPEPMRKQGATPSAPPPPANPAAAPAKPAAAVAKPAPRRRAMWTIGLAPREWWVDHGNQGRGPSTRQEHAQDCILLFGNGIGELCDRSGCEACPPQTPPSHDDFDASACTRGKPDDGRDPGLPCAGTAFARGASLPARGGGRGTPRRLRKARAPALIEPRAGRRDGVRRWFDWCTRQVRTPAARQAAGKARRGRRNRPYFLASWENPAI
jgi:hypothetical protein